MKKDIVIIGAGPAGLSFTTSLAETDLNVVLVEQQPKEKLANPDYDGREIALTHFSKHVLEKLGAWGKIDPEVISYVREAKVLDGDSPYMLHFDCREVCDDALGYMVSNQNIRKALYKRACELPYAEFMCGVSVENITTRPSGVEVYLSDGQVIEASLVVAADSRMSGSRQRRGIATSMQNFGRTVIVGKLTHDIDHHYVAYECFKYGGTLAMLPLAGGKESSAVITVATYKAQEILDMDDAGFGQYVQEHFGNRYGAMQPSSKRYSYPLMGTYANQFVAERFALIGDAAVGMHPVTAHGFNLGLRGQDTLAEQVMVAHRNGQNIGASSVLKPYESKHRLASKPLYMATNMIVKLYTDERPVPKLMRKAMLRLGNHIKPAKKAIMHQLTEIKDRA